MTSTAGIKDRVVHNMLPALSCFLCATSFRAKRINDVWLTSDQWDWNTITKFETVVNSLLVC
ncbi:hypothetical protein ACE6H2_018294 [Prunus campanulata]